MKNIIVIFFVFLAGNCWCQQFQKKYEVALPDTVVSTVSISADMDNDGLLDVVLICSSQSNVHFLQIVKGDTVSTPLLQLPPVAITQNEITGYAVTDYDHDNRMDIVVSGTKNNSPVTAVYVNQGSFTFNERLINVPEFSLLKVADIDNNGRVEWIVSGEEGGEYYFRILEQETANSWRAVHDSLKLKATAIEVIDQNGDGNPDIFVSGRIKPDSVMSTVLINRGGWYFEAVDALSRGGSSSVGDLNSDGLFDVVTMGNDQGNVSSTWLYESGQSSYNIRDLPIILSAAGPFTADLNSNGAADINYFGKTGSNDTLNLVQYDGQGYDTLNSSGLIQHQFADVDRDGDLDLLEIIAGEPIRLLLYTNHEAKKNKPPGIPTNAVALNIFSRTFIYWDKTIDDHTPVPTITYDLHLDGPSVSLTGNFDLSNDMRLLVSHGNNGTENFKLLRAVDSASLGFAVQAVDNSFHAGGLCVGSGMGGGSGMPCVINTETEALSLCSKEQVTLESRGSALWFSFSKGYLGKFTELVIQPSEPDTVFYYDPSMTPCSALKVWTIRINDDTVKTQSADKFACLNEDIELSVEPGWTNISWQSKVKGQLGSSSSIQYKVTQADSISVTMSNENGCKITRKTAVKLSVPEVRVSADNVKIAKGSAVTLNASGAQRYEWTPAAGLDHADSPAPVASPVTSTLYTVTGYDSLNCPAKATVNVIVEDGGFIPNLFTPNDDGKNDQLRIYGLSNAADFLFTVYNREGRLVFKTTSLVEAVQRGWDGTKNGSKQPPGVYFWKVKGEVSSGEKILLNGRDSGSIVLVR